MKTRIITNEQLFLLDKMVKEGKTNDEIYQVLGLKYYAIPLWKARLKQFGLGALLMAENDPIVRRVRMTEKLKVLKVGEELFVDDGEGFSIGSLVSSMSRLGRRFSRVREAIGWRLIRKS